MMGCSSYPWICHSWKKSDIILDGTFFSSWVSVVMVTIPGGNINEDDFKALMFTAQLFLTPHKKR